MIFEHKLPIFFPFSFIAVYCYCWPFSPRYFNLIKQEKTKKKGKNWIKSKCCINIYTKYILEVSARCGTNEIMERVSLYDQSLFAVGSKKLWLVGIYQVWSTYVKTVLGFEINWSILKRSQWSVGIKQLVKRTDRIDGMFSFILSKMQLYNKSNVNVSKQPYLHS